MKVVVRLQSQLRNEGVRTTQGSSIGNSYNFIFFNFTKTVMIQNKISKDFEQRDKSSVQS